MGSHLRIVDRRRIVICGRVQGIAFGVWMKSVADSLEVAGEMRVLPNGGCEVTVQGERSLVKQFVVACKRGPNPGAVEHTEVIEEPVGEKCFGFLVLR